MATAQQAKQRRNLMPLTGIEFLAIIDGPKHIDVDIHWVPKDASGIRVGFEVDVDYQGSAHLYISANHNQRTPTLSYSLILEGEGRIYGLDISSRGHRNSKSKKDRVGPKHKHRWDERTQDIFAYEPEDITAPASDPEAVWKQLCREARIIHNGKMHKPPPPRKDAAK